MAKMLSSRVVCSVLRTTSWLSRLVSRPARSASTSGAFTPAAHTTSSAGMIAPLASRTPFGQHLGDGRSRMHAHLEPCEQLCRRLRQPLGQLRQDARRGLDQVDLDVPVRIDAVEPVGDELARGLVQLGRQLRARRAGADDGDLQLLGPQRLGLGIGADAGVDQAAVEARGLLRPSPARWRAP